MAEKESCTTSEHKEVEEFQKEESVKEDVKDWPQYIATLSVTLFVLNAGTVLGWSSSAIPLLTKEREITETEVTWITSLMPLGAIVGPFPGGIAAEYIGRKKSMICSVLLLLISWGILAVPSHVALLYVGRFLIGFGAGWGMTVMPMYLGEISSPHLRGTLGVLGQIQICLGFLFTYSLGPFLPYLWSCVAYGFLTFPFFVSFIFMPETPHFLITKGQVTAAGKALMWLRGQSERGIKRELSVLQVEVEKSLENKGSWGDVFTHRGNRKAILIISGLMTLQQFSGINVVLFYSQSIFMKTGTNISPVMCTIVVGLVMTIASLVVPCVIENLGRRIVMIISAVGMALSLVCLGAYFYLDSTGSESVTNIAWLPLTSVIAYISFYSFGAGPVPWMMISEVFASNIRGKGSAFSSSFSWALAFVMTNSFGFVQELIGAHGAFWMFAIACAIGAVILYYCLPETKGKTLQEIQDMFNKK